MFLRCNLSGMNLTFTFLYYTVTIASYSKLQSISCHTMLHVALILHPYTQKVLHCTLQFALYAKPKDVQQMSNLTFDITWK